MRKIFAITLVLMLLMSLTGGLADPQPDVPEGEPGYIPADLPAQGEELPPQTRQEVIMLEGMEETITTTYTESLKGYAFWMDTNYLQKLPETEGAGMDDYASPTSTEDFRCEMSVYSMGLFDYSFEDAVDDTEQVLLDSYGNAEVFDATETFTNLNAVMVQATSEGRIITQYVVDAGNDAFTIALTYPMEAEEGFAQRVRWMLKSFVVLAGG